MNREEKKDALLVTGLVALSIEIIMLVIWATGGPALYSAGLTALVFAVIAAACFCWVIAMIVMEKRKPMIQYRDIKKQQVKTLRRIKRQGDLDAEVIQQQKNVFLIEANAIGVDQQQANDDFDLEIRRRVQP